MGIEVKTGGAKKFVYPKGHKPERDIDLEKEIDEGYKRYYERKKHESIIKILIALLIVIAVSGFLIYKLIL